MKVIRVNVDQNIKLTYPITACIGYFDGIHLGHQKLIEEVLDIARETNTQPSLITFEPDPWVTIRHIDPNEIPHITPMKHRMEICENMGIVNWIILEFDERMAGLNADEFHEKILYSLHLHTLVCGYDFHYGDHGRGDITTLQHQNCFHVRIIDEVSSEQKKISSTRIETLIKEGNIEKANRFLGRCFELRGHVKTGSHFGKKNGFPTANLALSDHYLLPKIGVYIGSVKVKDAWHIAIINVGHNPTYNYQEQTSIEAHIIDFDESIYGDYVKFRFHAWLRDEKKFDDAKALGCQLTSDVQTAKEYFRVRKEVLLCD